ncbi:HugZ family protein [Camelimonas abortus]|uniref:HugZ family protein n=1 Tax=Camelimonas abortus TaxID=1017184 RepID=A0ABV7LCN2_9HYPH
MKKSDAIAEAKKLLREARYGALATLEADGAPCASLVSLATAADGAPVTLLSSLARHTANIDRDSRVSLLLASVGGGDPLASPRISITGRMEPAGDPAVRRRFLARNPDAAMYAGFSDFRFFRIVPQGVRLVAGFGRVVALEPAELLTSLDGAADLVASEERVLAHMNADHADAVELYAVKLAGRGPGPWIMTGVDPEGMDLRLGDSVARAPFPRRVHDARALAALLRELAQQARAG